MHKDFVSENKLSKKSAPKSMNSGENCSMVKTGCAWGYAFFIVFLAILTGSLLLGGKFLWGSLQTLNANNAVMTTQYEKLQEHIIRLEKNSAYQEKILNDLRNQTHASTLKIIYAEGFYLIKNAIYQMKFGNLSGTTSLLNSALETLNNTPTSEPMVDAIKDQISEIITLLKTTQKVDDNAIAVQINQLQQQIDKLPLSLPKTLNSTEKVPPSDHYSQASDGLKEGWQQLKQLIIIRHYNKDVEPLIVPNQAIYLQQNLHLQLEQATLAIFYHNPKLYRLSLEKSQNWVKHFFDQRAKSTQIFLHQLDALLKIEIAQPVPKIEPTLNQILNKLALLIKNSVEKSTVEPKTCSIKTATTNSTQTEEKR